MSVNLLKKIYRYHQDYTRDIILKTYLVYDDKKLITVITEDERTCDHYDSLCGGCSDCLLKQAEHAGYDIIEAQTMGEKYGGNDDHIICPHCGLCIECGDCELSKCGTDFDNLLKLNLDIK